MQVYFSQSFSLYVLPSYKPPPQPVFNKNRKIQISVVSTWCYKMSCGLFSVFELLHCCLDENWRKWQGMIQWFKKSKLLKEITSYFCLKPTLPVNYQICVEHMVCFSTVNPWAMLSVVHSLYFLNLIYMESKGEYMYICI